MASLAASSTCLLLAVLPSYLKHYVPIQSSEGSIVTHMNANFILLSVSLCWNITIDCHLLINRSLYHLSHSRPSNRFEWRSSKNSGGQIQYSDFYSYHNGFISDTWREHERLTIISDQLWSCIELVYFFLCETRPLLLSLKSYVFKIQSLTTLLKKTMIPMCPLP